MANGRKASGGARRRRTSSASSSGAETPRPSSPPSDSDLPAVATAPTPPPAPKPEPPPTFYPEAAARFDEVVTAIEGDQVIGWAQDRIDPDAMAAAGLCYLILKKKYGKKFTCYTSRRMTFPMNRNLAKNFLPTGLLKRCEHEENLKEVVTDSELILVVDATSVEVMTDLNRLLQSSEDLRQKRIFFVDHHRRAAEGDLEGLENAEGIRIESAGSATAICVHLLLSLGLTLDPANEEEFKLAVAAKVGIEIDAIGQEKHELNEAAQAALHYLDAVVGEEGLNYVDKLRNLKNPVSWYVALGNALRLCEKYDQNVAVCGVGVIDDNGVLPYVANAMMDTGQFRSVIVFGIVYDTEGGTFLSTDLEASGRSQRNTEVALPDLFSEVFYWVDDAGRRISCGGGRASSVLGEHSSTGASVPLNYWLHYPTMSVEERIDVLRHFAWPAEFVRIRNLLAPKLGIKPDKILSVYPIPNGFAST